MDTEYVNRTTVQIQMTRRWTLMNHMGFVYGERFRIKAYIVSRCMGINAKSYIHNIFG